MPFPELPPDERLEEEVLARWGAQRVPERALDANRDGEPFVFYEGPPTANGRPAMHHVFARTLKDAVCRFRQMTGRFVPRKAGWDTQGLPVEIEVQKRHSLVSREDIERLGVAEFCRLCRESVFTYKEEWERLSLRMAYWLDYAHPYVTNESGYIQSVWAILSRFHAAGLLEKDFKSLPWCPRCSTGLSNHELAQGYADVQDPSAYVRFPLTAAAWRTLRGRLGERAGTEEPIPALLVWTTTPWTLFANLAVAVHPDLDYVLVRVGDERLLLADSRREATLGETAEVLGSFPGTALADLAYQRPLDEVAVDFESDAQRQVTFTVRLADFVSAQDGTGLVHIAPAFGADDFSLRQRDGLPLSQPIDHRGCFTAAVPGFAGRFVKEADGDILRLLKEKGLLFRRETVQHSYPHCWRCDSPLLYLARPSWYIRTTKLKDRLVESNRTIDWHPPEIGAGRFGEWLAGNVDWALSRERYWGTPLNVWVCEACGAEDAPASLAELGARRGAPFPSDYDPHKPQIDEVTYPCRACGGTARRTPEVVDCWFDSGAMPFAQAGWPQQTGGELPALFPADYICEGLDQTRGWFYTLHVIAVFLAGGPAYRSVLVNNLLLDAQGKKMSKHLGNVVDPWKVFSTSGADAARWAFVSQGQVWVPKRFDEKAVAEGARRVFGTLRNCYAFLALYANLDGFHPGDAAPPPEQRPSIDRWLLSRCESVSAEVAAAYERLDLHDVARLLETFLDEELSNWYVRRNRVRFWKSEVGADKRAAFATLAAALERLALLFAPVVPFLADALWRAVTGAGEHDSVHLTNWPASDPHRVDLALEREMDVVLAAVRLGRSVRAAHDLRTRQPLRRVLVQCAREEEAALLRRADLARLLADELNVKAVEVVERADFRRLAATPNFPRLGPRLGSRMKAVAAAVRALDEPGLERFLAERVLVLRVEGEELRLDAEDVEIVQSGKEGYAVAGDGRLVLALDTHLDDELLGEGRAREIVNRVQNTRKSAGLHVADRIVVRLSGGADLLAAARRHERFLLGEVLGTRLEIVDGAHAGAEAFDVDGVPLCVSVERVG